MYLTTLEVASPWTRTLCLCWEHTYLCSDHLAPGEFGTPRSDRKTRTSFWPRSRHISLRPYRWRAFCLLPLREDEKRAAIQLNSNNYGAMKTAVTSGTKSHTSLFSCSSLLLCHTATFSASHSRCQSLVYFCETCSFVFSSQSLVLHMDDYITLFCSLPDPVPALLFPLVSF